MLVSEKNLQRCLQLTVKAIAGWVADHTSSRQTPLLFGLGLAYGATLLFCFATSPFMLVLARCFQGFASSILFTAGLALIADSVSADEVGSWHVSALHR